jgi:hypothetical protein
MTVRPVSSVTVLENIELEVAGRMNGFYPAQYGRQMNSILSTL